jgi:hypothetical protein
MAIDTNAIETVYVGFERDERGQNGTEKREKVLNPVKNGKRSK